MLKPVVPDSLQYLVTDLIETVTIYDNKVKDVKVKPLSNGKYEVEVDYQVSKYRTDPFGKRLYEDVKGTALSVKDGKKNIQSLPLKDYVEVAVYDKPVKKGEFEVDNPLYLKKIKIDKINNKFKMVLDKMPYEVGVDPDNKLLDTDSNDNRKKI
jgi:ABC-2 type transport system permease protein